MAEFKITLEAARVNKRILQTQAATKLGISVATLRNYEKGKTVPDWDTVKAMENLYEIPADLFFFKSKLALSEKDAQPPTT